MRSREKKKKPLTRKGGDYMKNIKSDCEVDAPSTRQKGMGVASLRGEGKVAQIHSERI